VLDVPTEAKLARREGRDYEPAAELLRPIKEARTRTQQPKGRSRIVTKRARPAVRQARQVLT
jgi:hypothetical protein